MPDPRATCPRCGIRACPEVLPVDLLYHLLPSDPERMQKGIRDLIAMGVTAERLTCTLCSWAVLRLVAPDGEWIIMGSIPVLPGGVTP